MSRLSLISIFLLLFSVGVFGQQVDSLSIKNDLYYQKHMQIRYEYFNGIVIHCEGKEYPIGLSGIDDELKQKFNSCEKAAEKIKGLD